MSRPSSRIWIPALVLLGSAATARAAADDDADRARAHALFEQANCQDALPLYERLAIRHPEDAGVAEEQSFCLMMRVQLLGPGAERDAAFAAERAAAERARALGDHGNLLQTVFDHLATPLPPASAVVDDAALAAAERSFSQGDLDGALAQYQRIAAGDPRSYPARLFAGDVYFRKKDLARAAEWFRAAIAVDPDRETAHRYWGDALDADGQTGAALEHFIDAVVAEPYSRLAWVGLSQWASRHHAHLARPNVPSPKVADPPPDPAGAAPTIEVDPANPAAAAWLLYSGTRITWRRDTFQAAHPGEAYRHTLQEEVDALGFALELAATDATQAQGLGDLPRLAADGFLEAYVLISAADAGLARDYGAYRAAHRDQLHAYLARWVVQRDAAR